MRTSLLDFKRANGRGLRTDHDIERGYWKRARG